MRTPRVEHDAPNPAGRAGLRVPGVDAIQRGPLERAFAVTKASLPAWFQSARRTMATAALAAVIGASLSFGTGGPVAEPVAGPVAGPAAPPSAPVAASAPQVVESVDAVTQADPRAELEQVRSLAVEQASEALTAAHRQLGKAQKRRTDAIEGLLANMRANGSSAAATDRVQSDLLRPIEQIAATKDSPRVHPGLRSDVTKWLDVLHSRERELSTALDAFAKLDEAYLATADQLAQLGLRPADLKALVAQESGDHLLRDTKGDIAGIAQIGAREVREVAPHLDRKDDAQAIELAALVLSKKAEHLEAMLDARGLDFAALRASPDYHRFLFAAYNAGAEPIARAMKIAHDTGLDYTSWAAVLGDAGTPSSLHAALRATQTYRGKASSKLDEVTTYVERIDARRPPTDLDGLS